MEKNKIYFLLLAVVVIIATFGSCSSHHEDHGTHDSSADETKEDVTNQLPSIADMDEDDFKNTISEFLTSKFGRMAKVTKWISCDKWIDNKAVSISGEASAVVRGDKNTYSFNAILNEYGRVKSFQMDHKGQMDSYFNWVEGRRLDDNIIKSKYNYKGIVIRAIGLREAGIRYVTSQKMNKNQIMDFIINWTDIQRKNYYFQMSENSPEYAQYSGDGYSGILTTYSGNGHFYNVSIDENGTISINE